MKRFLVIWVGKDSRAESSQHDGLVEANKSIEYLVNAGYKPKLFQLLRDYK